MIPELIVLKTNSKKKVNYIYFIATSIAFTNAIFGKCCLQFCKQNIDENQKQFQIYHYNNFIQKMHRAYNQKNTIRVI